MRDPQLQKSPEETAGLGGGDTMLNSLLAGLLQQWEQQQQQQSDDPAVLAGGEGSEEQEEAGVGIENAPQESAVEDGTSTEWEAPPVTEWEAASAEFQPDELAAMEAAIIEALREEPLLAAVEEALSGEQAGIEPLPSPGLVDFQPAADFPVEATLPLDLSNLEWQVKALAAEATESQEAAAPNCADAVYIAPDSAHADYIAGESADAEIVARNFAQAEIDDPYSSHAEMQAAPFDESAAGTSALLDSANPFSKGLLDSLLEQSAFEQMDETTAVPDEIVAAAEEAAEDREPEAPLPSPATDWKLRSFAWEVEPAQEAVASLSKPWSPPARKVPVDASASRRESMLRLLAAMYPEAAHRITGQAAVEAAVPSAKRSVADGYVVFQLGGESFGVGLRYVLEADRLPAMTPVPFVPEFVRGVTNRRGDVLPLIDLRLLLGVDTGALAGGGRMLVVRRNENEPPAALIVDGLGGIAWFDRLPGGGDSSRIAGRFPDLLGGAGEHRGSTVHILDIERLFARKELEELTAV